MSWREERAIRCQAAALVAEAEAMVAGRLIDLPWAAERTFGQVVVNALAHADWVQLEGYSSGTHRSGSLAWDGALIFLADELRGAVGSPEELVAAQRAQLIPIELDILEGTVHEPATPAGLVSLLRPRIARAASRHRHCRDSKRSPMASARSRPSSAAARTAIGSPAMTAPSACQARIWLSRHRSSTARARPIASAKYGRASSTPTTAAIRPQAVSARANSAASSTSRAIARAC